ncbi:helix-turn-helix transcriptional regulator [Nocardiopsis tropica]|uniref:helix-turn-helix domain-containing protein n=1 Tax=Nocardiopsis tropica TaxID=109330 RepID=UPI002E8A8734|nr:helix-turn-helix transcriptional regulator [Nocardiopsis tropica]
MSAPNPLFVQLIEAREALGLTRAEMARRMGYSTSALLYWEKGRTSPSIDVMQDYAAVVGMSVTVQPTETTGAATHDMFARTRLTDDQLAAVRRAQHEGTTAA